MMVEKCYIVLVSELCCRNQDRNVVKDFFGNKISFIIYEKYLES